MTVYSKFNSTVNLNLIFSKLLWLWGIHSHYDSCASHSILLIKKSWNSHFEKRLKKTTKVCFKWNNFTHKHFFRTLYSLTGNSDLQFTVQLFFNYNEKYTSYEEIYRIKICISLLDKRFCFLTFLYFT